MSNAKLVNITRLMTSYNFDIEQLPDSLKCAQCKLVLKDAWQVPCGCIFCRVCIDDMVASGGEVCPGDSEDCRDTVLSSAAPDYKVNKSVLRLVTKCPHDGCVHECQLADMEEHLRECPRKGEECPFRELGCTQDKMAANEISGHLQQDTRRHSEQLIGMVANINREIETLKRRDGNSRREIEVLKSNLVMKDGQISSLIDRLNLVENENKSIKNDIKSMKGDNRYRADPEEILERNTGQEIGERRENHELDRAGTVVEHHVNTVTNKIMVLIGSNKVDLITGIQSIMDNIQSTNQITESIKSDICSMKSQLQSVEALVGLGWVDARFDWMINENLEDSNWNWRDKASATFTGTVHRYTCGLAASNYTNIFEKSLDVWFRIYSGPNDAYLQLPFEGRVVVTVADRFKREVCRSISRQCRLHKPLDNTYRNTDSLIFPHFELVGAGLDLCRGVCVSCLIIPSGGQ